MRRELWFIALVVSCLVATQQFVDAQQSSSPTPRNQTCPASKGDDDKRTGPDISIGQVTFSGDLQMPVPDQDAIAESIRQTSRGTVLDNVVGEALDRARTGWQDRGYFKVEVRGDTKTLTASPVAQRIALELYVDEGLQYRLSGINFKNNNNKAIKSSERLRQLFPINDGDIFSREQIAVGLENLRKAYGELGYLNFTSVPDTAFDAGNKQVSLTVDIDEGQQFRVGAIKVFGLENMAREQLLQSLPIKRGQIFNSQVWEKVLAAQPSLFPHCECDTREDKRLDEKSGLVTFTLDFRPCTVN